MNDSKPAETAAEIRLPKFPGVAEFIFDGPLYSQFALIDNTAIPLFYSPFNIDGHCPWCNERSTFARESTSQRSLQAVTDYGNGSHSSTWLCARNRSHKIYIIFRLLDLVVWKIGQDPSLADIANDAAREYRSVLKGIDKNELSKAIGLAAHGVGVGSFVYIRRVFERLIARRQSTSGIEDTNFHGKRMSEKIDILRDHLPAFLYENKNIYGILSKGVHELSEQECLAFYPVMYESIVMILDEDRRKAQEEERRKRLSEAIRTFSS